MKYLTLLAFIPVVALGAGDKNQWNNPIFGEDQCVVMLPAGIDLNTCEEIPSSDPSLQTYRCDQSLTIYCPDDGPQAPGQNK